MFTGFVPQHSTTISFLIRILIKVSYCIHREQRGSCIKKYKNENIQAHSSSQIQTRPVNYSEACCSQLFPWRLKAWRRRGWGGKRIRCLPHKPHEGLLLRGKLLSHERLQPSRERREQSLAELAEILTPSPTVGVVAPAGAVVTLILL